MTKYNDKVSKAMESVGRDVNQARRDNLKKYKEKMNAELERVKLSRVQYVYARFLEKESWTKKELMDKTGASEHLMSDILKELDERGLINSTIIDTRYRMYTYTIINDRYIPLGWPPKDELIKMKLPFLKSEPKKKTLEEKEESKIVNNPLTKMLRNRDLHVEDVEAYKLLMEDTKRYYGKKEIDDLIDAIHEICRIRIEQQWIPCPLCKGRIQRNVSEAICTKCGAKVNGGTFEKSMEMLTVLGKAGIKVNV